MKLGAVRRVPPTAPAMPSVSAAAALRPFPTGAPMLANDILRTIGNTPHIRINRLFGTGHHVYVKSERSNPGGSIKDRIALAMIEAAERDGHLQAGGTIIEPTSGNTGVG